MGRFGGRSVTREAAGPPLSGQRAPAIAAAWGHAVGPPSRNDRR